MTDRELMQMALDALEDVADDAEESHKTVSAIKALRAALANQFNPDWDQVEALQESLREHMAEIQRLRARLAQPEQEPVWVEVTTNTGDKFILDSAVEADKIRAARDAGLLVVPLYTAPPQREWQGLTDEEIEDACWTEVDQRLRSFARAIEAKLKEKNT